MNAGSALMGSAMLALAAAGSRVVIRGVIAADGAQTTDIVTQVGVFGAAIAVGYYMLRRGDLRERGLTGQAQADLKAMRDEMALMRADYLQARDQLIAALTENAVIARELAELRKGHHE